MRHCTKCSEQQNKKWWKSNWKTAPHLNKWVVEWRVLVRNENLKRCKWMLDCWGKQKRRDTVFASLNSSELTIIKGWQYAIRVRIISHTVASIWPDECYYFEKTAAEKRRNERMNKMFIEIERVITFSCIHCISTTHFEYKINWRIRYTRWTLEHYFAHQLTKL